MQTLEEIVPTPEAPVSSRVSPWSIFASPSFRKLWFASTLSLFGYFFSYIAMAWLVLLLTGSSLALGSVLVVESLPRAVLMLVGGAMADRFSPRTTMLASMGLRTAFVAPFAALVVTGHAQLWQAYVIALVMGVGDAFFLPARTSILPSLVASTELEAGNAVLNVSGQAAIVLGPVLAGVIVATVGTGWAFASDAFVFAAGIVFVLLLPSTRSTTKGRAHPDGGLGGQIVAGFRYAWADFGIRLTLIVIAVIDFAAIGAFGVGLPTLAHSRFGAGAVGLGILLGAWGIGATAGAIGAGIVRPPKRMGLLIAALSAWLGLGIVGVGLVPSLVLASALMGISGVGTGVVNTYGISWLQRRTDPSMQGRVMSLVMLASQGLAPIGYAVSGFVAQVNPTVLFLVAGGMMLACAVGAFSSRQVRSLT
jgi:MFS family permease